MFVEGFQQVGDALELITVATGIQVFAQTFLDPGQEGALQADLPDRTLIQTVEVAQAGAVVDVLVAGDQAN